ncbi:MAG: citrate/2-methylcitrate synthase [Thermodesulfobacteriota bacterium]
MECITNIKNIGLRDIPVADTLICGIDAKKGVLIYRGYDVLDLAANSTYEETVFLLLEMRLPMAQELAEFTKRLSFFRQVPEAVIQAMRLRPSSASPMDVLQGAAAFLADYDPNVRDESRPAEVDRGLRIIGAFPTLVAAWERIRKGLPVVPPDPSLSHAADFLRMLTGNRADPQTERDLDACLILHAEHSFNASTFTARAVASTRSHTYGAVAAAVASLAGELHGGANTRVMMMLEEVGSKDRVRQWVTERLEAGKRIMGLGHAVYEVDDPRVKILKPMAEAIAKRKGQEHWYDLAVEIERVAKEEFQRLKGRYIPTNVDFYSAPTYHAMGIPKDLFTPIFAVARTAGWVAHIIEERLGEAQGKPQLYRPQADYIGSYCGPDKCEWKPLEKRA